MGDMVLGYMQKSALRLLLIRLAVFTLLLAIGIAVSSCSNNQKSEKPGAPNSSLVYRDKNGRELTEKDLADVSGEVNWSVVGSNTVPPNAKELHAQAQQEGSAGNYKKALDLLAQAHKLAPAWPYPLYDTAYTYLLMGDSAKALENYEAVCKMAPRGFFTAITAADSLRREKSGQLKRGTYKKYLMLESVTDLTEKKVELQKMTEEIPGFAPGWKDLSIALEGDPEKLHAIETGLSHDPDGETKGFLLINKALILSRSKKDDEAVRILGDLALDPKSPLDVEQIAKATLANIRHVK